MGKAVWQDCKGAMVLSGAYDEAVKMMGDIGFLTALQNFHKEGITDETVELLKPYFSAPDFNYESAKKVRVIDTHAFWKLACMYEADCYTSEGECRRGAKSAFGLRRCTCISSW